MISRRHITNSIRNSIDVSLACSDAITLPYKSYALLRSGLAFATLLTLLFNPIDTIFPRLIEDNFQFYNKLVFFNTNISLIIFENILFYKWISVIILALVISGVFPRITGVFHFFVAFTFAHVCPIIDGGDQLTSNLSLLLLPLTLMDNAKNHWTSSMRWQSGVFPKVLTLFFLFLVKLQICVVYLHSSIAKFGVAEWTDGTVIWYWFNHEVFGLNSFLRPIILPIISQPIIIFSMTWFVLILEFTIGMLLFADTRKIPKIVYYLGVIFHASIILVHGIFSFGLTMIFALTFYFKIMDRNYDRIN